MSHTCHAPGCDAPVPPRMFACRRHWADRPGQETDKQPSFRYMAVQTIARARLAFKPHDEVAVKLTAKLILEANAYRTEAVRRREGDPFAALGDPFAALGDPKLVELPLMNLEGR